MKEPGHTPFSIEETGSFHLQFKQSGKIRETAPWAHLFHLTPEGESCKQAR